ncbi:fused MFS/spermidine synthase [Stigmatella sp. ncwal1]|uniref:Fused MFS/spermidine synthase n=1 Tax=Stigmatella ashevillensis TaxID=2995309 RepID=A0ABT5D2W7_9BACT|nr:fused MFS/spermidine synthase [Stigmatella ashevillena]MDC0708010.1 fused MFS/spermidine synthase [Stigmatella ashevillena]
MVRYAFTLFTSAFLLFGVQPLAGKFALPWFGGTPAVWTACMLFFQAALLGGYAYAHGLVTRFSPRRQAQVHLGLLVLAVGVLAGRALLTGSPVAPGLEWRPQGVEGLTGRLLAMLAVTIGLPFFVLSTSAPLLQSWFSRAWPGRSPYRLYALSNAGSLLALLIYPFGIEPVVPRALQGWAWAAGFLVFAAGCAACAWDMKGRAGAAAPTEEEAAASEEDAGRPGLGRTLLWLGLSACASVLLLATTNQLSQDVAAGPFLWVLPLAIYLLTFILAFEREALYSRAFFSLLLVVAVGGVTRVALEGPHTPLGLQLLAYCGALLAGCMVCHGELYRLRPSPRHLSAFFLCVSIGGVLGGAFVSLVAPHLFLTFAEYPLALTACCLVALVALIVRPTGEERAGKWRRMLRVFMLAFVVVGLGVSAVDFRQEIRLTARNFFGVVQVLEQSQSDALKHRFTLKHGAIVHGVQYTESTRRKQPMSYFTRESGLGLAIAEHRRLRGALELPSGLRIGVLGLGIGSSAALAQAGDSVRFYEINPKIISLARGEGGYFSYLSDATARIEVVEGDARIALEHELERHEPQGFDVLAVDVFSSDSIPVHLLTEEAVAVYRQHLAPHGVLALHISNAHLDLVPITLAHARAFAMHATLVVYEPKDASARSVWVILSPDAEFSWSSTFRQATASVRRLELDKPPSLTWTDERGSVLPLLRRGDWVTEAREIIPPPTP